MKLTRRNLALSAACLLAGSWFALTTQGADDDRQAPPLSKEFRASADPEAFRFAVVGDTGTGGSDQRKIALQMIAARKSFPFDVVVMMGDNMYGGEKPKDYVKKFEQPYAELLSDGVKFYASLGNHDDTAQRFYNGFNMNGQRYHTFRPFADVRFFALDSNYMDKEQLEWLEKELGASGSTWKIPFFHHPLYSSGETHGSSEDLRSVLEPMFLKHGVSVVLAGHEHFYERIKPQHGITYFTVGSSAKLRKGDIARTDLTAKGFDRDHAFMLCEIKGDTLSFQAITKAGQIVDSGMISRQVAKAAAASAE